MKIGFDGNITIESFLYFTRGVKKIYYFQGIFIGQTEDSLIELQVRQDGSFAKKHLIFSCLGYIVSIDLTTNYLIINYQDLPGQTKTIAFRYNTRSEEEFKWVSFTQKIISGSKLYDRFEWDNFLIYYTDEDIHFFKEPPYAILNNEQYHTDYELVSTKNQSITFKEEKMLGLVAYGKTLEDLSMLTYDIEPVQKTNSQSDNGNEYSINQQILAPGIPIFNCESADEDMLLGTTIEFVLAFMKIDDSVEKIKYRLTFIKQANQIDIFLYSVFILVLLLISVMLIFTCNNVRMVKMHKEEYMSVFRQYIRGATQSGSKNQILDKSILGGEEEEEEFCDQDQFNFGFSSAKNRVQYSYQD